MDHPDFIVSSFMENPLVSKGLHLDFMFFHFYIFIPLMSVNCCFKDRKMFCQSYY